jgi:hypothetical protein
MNGEAGIVLGGVLRTAISTALVDVTTIYWQTKWKWLVPYSVKFPGWKSMFRIFSLPGWLSIFEGNDCESRDRFLGEVRDL